MHGSPRISSERTAIPATVVLDASAILRARTSADDGVAARRWIDAIVNGRLTAVAPDLIYLEAANALAGYVRNGDMDTEEAAAALADILEIPIDVHQDRLLAAQALELATTRRISAYDASYLALTLGYDAVLVTADRRLASGAERSALLPGATPPR